MGWYVPKNRKYELFWVNLNTLPTSLAVDTAVNHLTQQVKLEQVVPLLFASWIFTYIKRKVLVIFTR